MSTFSERWGVPFRATLLVAAGWWIFSPTLFGGWLWEDNIYITQNLIKHAPDGLWKIWFEPGNFIEYYPIEASVQWVQWHWWHTIPLGYHFTNICLHLLSAFLVWHLFSKLGLRLAWLGGLIFVCHPVTVESVAWITELKNTLSLPPFLLAICAFMDYDERRKPGDYLLALTFFLVAMLCKITMALFPVVILLYAWWKRGRIGSRDLRDSAPFFLISLALGLTAIQVGNRYAQLHGLGDNVVLGGFFSRLACAGLSLSFYFFKYLWPVGLLPIYPQWRVDPPSLVQFLPWPILGSLLYWFWKNRQSWGRHALLGCGFFVINLAPFLGFNAISYMSFTWVMDHFLYLPAIGLIGLTIAGLEYVDEKVFRSMRPYGAGFVTMVMILLACQSHAYARKFTDEETLWTYTAQRDPNAWAAYNNLGNALLQKGRVVKAGEQYEKALQINPGSASLHNNLGVVLEQMGQIANALAQYQEALRIAPGYLDARNNLARLESLREHPAASPPTSTK